MDTRAFSTVRRDLRHVPSTLSHLCQPRPRHRRWLVGSAALLTALLRLGLPGSLQAQTQLLSDTSVLLTWDAPLPDVFIYTAFLLERQPAGSMWSEFADIPAPLGLAEDAQIVWGEVTCYRIRDRAVTPEGLEAYSAYSDSQPCVQALPPGAPAPVTATASSAAVTLTWGSLDPLLLVDVWRQQSGKAALLIGTVTGTSYRDTLVRKRQTYCYSTRYSLGTATSPAVCATVPQH